jgi:hypothetical protein
MNAVKHNIHFERNNSTQEGTFTVDFDYANPKAMEQS